MISLFMHAGVVKSSAGGEQWEEVAWIDKGVQTLPWTLPAMQVTDSLKTFVLRVLLELRRKGLSLKSHKRVFEPPRISWLPRMPQSALPQPSMCALL